MLPEIRVPAVSRKQARAVFRGDTRARASREETPLTTPARSGLLFRTRAGEPELRLVWRVDDRSEVGCSVAYIDAETGAVLEFSECVLVHRRHLLRNRRPRWPASERRAKDIRSSIQ
jgi:hypothetical protein